MIELNYNQIMKATEWLTDRGYVGHDDFSVKCDDEGDDFVYYLTLKHESLKNYETIIRLICL